MSTVTVCSDLCAGKCTCSSNSFLCEGCGQRLVDMSFDHSKSILQDLAHVRERQIRLNKVLEHSDVIKGRVKELKQTPKGANWLYQMLTMFRKTYPIDLLAALKKLVTNKNDSAILAAIIENEADPSQLERVEQFACAKHLVEEGRAFFDMEYLQRQKCIPLTEVSTRFMRSVRWKGDSVMTKRK